MISKNAKYAKYSKKKNRTRTAAPQIADFGNTLAKPPMAIVPPTPTMKPTRVWISVSTAKARKRLPTPAIAKSSEVCSGVSMVSFSV